MWRHAFCKLPRGLAGLARRQSQVATRTGEVHGRITVVQEQRFRLATDGGQSYLFTLAHDAPLEASDLCRFRDQDARVVVEYEGEPGLDSGVAYGAQPAT